MLLTVSKRLEFSASRRLHDPKADGAGNLAAFGAESAARYGTGRNYVCYFVLAGEVNPATGMLVNISEIKARAGAIVNERFDHKFLNQDHPAFREQVPTAENIARQLFLETAPSFRDMQANLVAVHLRENQQRSATAFADGALEANHWIDFSAARQTMSPHLSQKENSELFGAAASPAGHGHHYRARVTFRAATESAGQSAQAQLVRVLRELQTALDHKNLNLEVPGLAGQPVTTEAIARYLRAQVANAAPVERVRLHERDDFFAEAWSSGAMFLGMRQSFSAAHRLHSTALSEAENRELYSKCNNELGHGHTYVAEGTISGKYDERSGIIARFDEFQRGLEMALSPWQDRHLDLEVKEFRKLPSTGENIVQALWRRLEPHFGDPLVRLRLWETANNRFTLRRT